MNPQQNTPVGEGKDAVISKQIFDEQAAKFKALETELATEKENHLATMQVNEQFQQRIEELERAPKKSAAASAKDTKVPTASFKVDKVDYVVTTPSFRYKGNLITAAQLLENKDLQAELVKAGVGIIKRKGE